MTEQKIHDINKVKVDGVEVLISKARLEDIETIEAMSDIQAGDALAIIPLFRKLFGDDYTRIKTELKGDDETLSIEKMSEWFSAVLEELGAKN